MDFTILRFYAIIIVMLFIISLGITIQIWLNKITLTRESIYQFIKKVPKTGWAITSFEIGDKRCIYTFANECQWTSNNIAIAIYMTLIYRIYWFIIIMPLVCLGIWSFGEE